MTAWMRKIGVDLVEKALEAVQEPAFQQWRNISSRALQNRGSELYSTQLLPGFEGTEGSELLLLPDKDQYEATGDAYGQKTELSALKTKADGARARKMLLTMAKIGEEDGFYPTGDIHTLPQGSLAMQRDRESSINQAFERIDGNQRGESSEMPEPGMKNAETIPEIRPQERVRRIEAAFDDQDAFSDTEQIGAVVEKASSADFKYTETRVEEDPARGLADDKTQEIDPNVVESAQAWRDFRAFDTHSEELETIETR